MPFGDWDGDGHVSAEEIAYTAYATGMIEDGDNPGGDDAGGNDGGCSLGCLGAFIAAPLIVLLLGFIVSIFG